MRVHQVPISVHPLLGRMAAALAEAAPVPPAVVGDWRADVAAGIPEEDRDLAAARAVAHLQELQAAFQPGDPRARARAALYYPPGGGMGWHTNSAAPGWRIYVPRVRDAYAVSGTLTSKGCFLDRPGFANLFYVSTWRASWHAVVALTERYSLGVLVEDSLAAEILGSPSAGG